MFVLSYIIVKESPPLKGSVRVSGSKNAVLPIIAATLLAEGTSVINGVPNLKDVQVMSELLCHLGARVSMEGEKLIIDATNIEKLEAPYNLVNKMRASFLVMGPLLSRYRKAKISMPGGCAIGSRPIDLHLKGFRALGAEIVNHEHTYNEQGYVEASVNGDLVGEKIYLDFPSVGATENIMMAAVFAKGVTVIENAAEEPEIVDLANYLNNMGAKVRGAGTNTIRITGVEALKPVEYTVIPDRIEAGTYMVAAALTRGDVVIENVIPDHVKPAIAKLTEIGCHIEEYDSAIRVVGPEVIESTTIKTMPHPGFPTDLQSLFMALLCLCDGKSTVTETVFENRFMNAPELMRMGANIEINGKTATIKGVSCLIGAEVVATDLRAGAALIIGGLVAKGETKVRNIYHIDRGYVDIVGKLSNLGAKVYRVEEE